MPVIVMYKNWDQDCNNEFEDVILLRLEQAMGFPLKGRCGFSKRSTHTPNK